MLHERPPVRKACRRKRWWKPRLGKMEVSLSHKTFYRSFRNCEGLRPCKALRKYGDKRRPEVPGGIGLAAAEVCGEASTHFSDLGGNLAQMRPG